jgi:hypothetical protein
MKQRAMINLHIKKSFLPVVMMHTSTSRRIAIMTLLLVTLLMPSCNSDSTYLRYALRQAGDNRAQLEAVLEHYKDDPEKYAAACYLIENMPAHYSYRGDDILRYYETALPILKSGKSPAWQRDTLMEISDRDFPSLSSNVVPDVEIITSDFLIQNIDHAFKQWKERPWASHLTFEEFCEWLLPYKLVELQSLDAWRDTLSTHFSDSLNRQPITAPNYGTIFGTQDIVRNEILRKVHPCGFYTRSGYELLGASVLPYQTYGRCIDYVTLGVLTYRSVGIPAVIDETPFWGRYRAGHAWYTILSDQGKELSSEWDITSVPGWGFFPYERIPKVYRSTYAINRDRVKYRNTAKYVYPFELCQRDITDRYYKTSDVSLTLLDGVRSKLKDKYVYIAVFNGHDTDWSIVDYGKIKRGKACFTKMGRNILYIAKGYDGKNLIPITEPFIIEKDGSIRYIKSYAQSLRSVDIRRKYYQSANVVSMRRRLLGGRIEASDNVSFRDAVTLFTIDTLALSDKTPLPSDHKYRYWRYLSANGTYGSIAELAFYAPDSTILTGTPLACAGADTVAIKRAFDGDYVSNFETGQADGNWVGLDMGHSVNVGYVRIIPRSDDNDIRAGDEYEFMYWNGSEWISSGSVIADDTHLVYDNIPQGALMWVRNYTRGWDERPFLIDGSGNVEWW